MQGMHTWMYNMGNKNASEKHTRCGGGHGTCCCCHSVRMRAVVVVTALVIIVTCACMLQWWPWNLSLLSLSCMHAVVVGYSTCHHRHMCMCACCSSGHGTRHRAPHACTCRRHRVCMPAYAVWWWSHHELLVSVLCMLWVILQRHWQHTSAVCKEYCSHCTYLARS